MNEQPSSQRRNPIRKPKTYAIERVSRSAEAYKAEPGASRMPSLKFRVWG